MSEKLSLIVEELRDLAASGRFEWFLARSEVKPKLLRMADELEVALAQQAQPLTDEERERFTRLEKRGHEIVAEVMDQQAQPCKHGWNVCPTCHPEQFPNWPGRDAQQAQPEMPTRDEVARKVAWVWRHVLTEPNRTDYEIADAMRALFAPKETHLCGPGCVHPSEPSVCKKCGASGDTRYGYCFDCTAE